MIRVREGWRASYDPALRVAAGEPLVVGHRDDEWPGWVWCLAGGLGGWLPEEVVGDGRARADFDTRELTAAEGDVLEPLGWRSGWTWCRGRNGEGWVPDRCLDRGAGPVAPEGRASGARSPAWRASQDPSETSANS